MADEITFSVIEPHFQDPLKAAEYLEGIRWPNGPVCPHCGEGEKRHYPLKSKTRRLYKCAACRKQFTVTVGTIFEGSHVGLNKWLLAFYLLCSSKKGMSAHQLHRMLGVTYKTAWFMAHRIRYAMEQPPFKTRLKGTVEVDETYVGGKVRRSNRKQYVPLDPNAPDVRRRKGGRNPDEKTPVVALVERGGQVRSFRMATVTADELGAAIRRNVSRQAHLRTDLFPSYTLVGREYASHETVNHLYEYVRGDAHTNTAENFFSILKRGINGVYHHVSEAHLPRYLSEFDFRYNTRSAN
ncbi:MAG TPA: IS1595 family transposase, partial [Gaiellaceae bacterium]|nr:IS1595 family transposase [Gaiellaceae bacterium]